MKASEMVRQLQEAIALHGDHEFCHTETGLAMDEIVFHMPSFADREAWNAQPFYTAEQAPFTSRRGRDNP